MTSEHQDSPSEALCRPSESTDLKRPTTADEFFTIHHESMEGYALRLSRSPETAREAVQDTYIAAVKHWHRIQYPEAWIRKAILRRVIKIEKQGRKEMSRAEFRDEADFLGQTVTPTPDDAYAAKETEQLFREAVASLTDEQRLILAMRMDGRKHKEIAEQLDMREDAVKMAWSRLKARLRQILGVPEQRNPGIRKGSDSKDGKEVKA
ncbi:RNA polymerase sigma factor [Streptomyces mirabilis]|uniref:RNA polymerase sigma factor n=1 Tax=Streptomyces mirabilis TaxID=68239 RepID=UPI0036CEB883